MAPKEALNKTAPGLHRPGVTRFAGVKLTKPASTRQLLLSSFVCSSTEPQQAAKHQQPKPTITQKLVKMLDLVLTSKSKLKGRHLRPPPAQPKPKAASPSQPIGCRVTNPTFRRGASPSRKGAKIVAPAEVSKLDKNPYKVNKAD